MKKEHFFPILRLAGILLFCSCFHNPVEFTQVSENYKLFASVWELFESDYPEFPIKSVDWKHAFYTYSPMAEEAASYEDIVTNAILPMLAELRDVHVFMYSPSDSACYPQYPQPPVFWNYNLSVLFNSYLRPAGFSGISEHVGFCDQELLPYLIIDSWGQDCNIQRAREYVELCEGLPAMIIDVRMNHGGAMAFGMELAGFFTPSTRSAFYARSRNGSGYDDVRYTLYYTWPDNYTLFEGEVYLLIGRGCASATETFTLFMNCLDNVTVIGDTTGGAGAFTTTIELEGGWKVRAPAWSLRTMEKAPVEWFGIPPDIYVEATEEDFAQGIDPVLEYAIDLVNSQY